MDNQNPKIGTIDVNGNPQYPRETVFGQPIDAGERDQVIGHTVMLSATTFAILDMFVPRGSDAQAAIDALKAEIALPASAEAVKPVKKLTPPDLPTTQA